VAGFLSTGAAQSSTQGNYALYDIVAALQWIKDNVRSFGGDHHQVTLMGHGHGAALVNLLAISPLLAGYVGYMNCFSFASIINHLRPTQACYTFSFAAIFSLFMHGFPVDHSIAFNKTVIMWLCRRATRQPCGTVSLCDDTTATRRCRTAVSPRRCVLCDRVTWTF